MYIDKIIASEQPLEQISIDKVEEFFSTEQDENLRLEMKSFDGITKKGQPVTPDSVFKTLSAFSNNDGGILIWGAPDEGNHKDKNGKVIRKYCKGTPRYLPLATDIDALCRKVRSGISPSASHIEIHPVKNHNKGYVIFFRVGKTMIPVMANDNIFYIRTNLESEKAPYAIVDALFKRKGHSDLNLTEIEIKTGDFFPNNRISGGINFEISNNSPMISAEQAYLEIIPSKSIIRTPSHPNEPAQVFNHFCVRHRLINPLNSGFGYKLHQHLAYSNLDHLDGHLELIVRLSALNCPVKESKLILTLNEEIKEISMTIEYKNRLVNIYNK